MAPSDANEEEGGGVLALPSDKLILIVDDDESQRDLLEYLVAKEGFRLDKAASGAEAVNRAVAAQPDLILLDLMMPGKGGYEVVKDLQAEGEGGIPVVIVTARSMDRRTIEELRRESNVKDFFQKPPHHATLAALLHSLLKTRPPSLERAL